MSSNRDTAYDAATSADYVEVDDRVGWAFGYPFALRALGVGGPDAPETLLDYGCGPGKVAQRVARRYGLRVVAADPSAEMLAIATQRHSHPRVTYHQVPENPPTLLADESIDAAMTCFVFVVLPSREQLRAIVAEVWRVLRPGGRFVILDPHPDQVGVQFCSFRSGEPGVTYQEGGSAPRPTAADQRRMAGAPGLLLVGPYVRRDSDRGRLHRSADRGALARGCAGAGRPCRPGRLGLRGRT